MPKAVTVELKLQKVVCKVEVDDDFDEEEDLEESVRIAVFDEIERLMPEGDGFTVEEITVHTPMSDL